MFFQKLSIVPETITGISIFLSSLTLPAKELLLHLKYQKIVSTNKTSQPPIN
jgi:hypothetical protein